MRKIVYQVWISLDGYAADANHSTKFFEDPKYGEASDEDLLKYMDNFDTILLGANTYKMFVEFWPTEAIAFRKHGREESYTGVRLLTIHVRSERAITRSIRIWP